MVRQRRILMWGISVGTMFLVVFLATAVIQAQAATTTAVTTGGSTVGGVEIDADGVLTTAPKKSMEEVGKALAKLLEPLPSDLNQESAIRKISLKKLNESMRQTIEKKGEFSDTVRFLGGLTAIHYVVVVPEENDILLVGPAEGWKVDALGNIVGKTSGRPILRLEDFLTVYRSWNTQQRPTVISCSIDPTPEAIARIAKINSMPITAKDADAYADAVEKAYGMNVVTIKGVPDRSRFAKILAAADYKMKRVGLGQEPSNVRGLPSYVSMLSGNAKEINPRFWLAPEYSTVSHDSKKLTWQLGTVKVKALSEDEYVDSRSGSRQSTGKLDKVAIAWCSKMTAKYDDLAKIDPLFAELKNCMEIAIVVALIQREGLLEKADCKLTAFNDESVLKIVKDYPVPRFVPSKATIEKNGRAVIVACGGVEVNPFNTLAQSKLDNSIDKEREKLVGVNGENWWANGK